MRRWYSIVFGLVILAGVGCNQGTSTAPSTDPSRPNADRKLTVVIADAQTVTQDKTDEVLVTINRTNVAGPVDVEFKDLPSGVELMTKEMTIPADKSTVTATIKAAADAKPVAGHSVTVTAKAKDHKDVPEAKTNFKLDVKSK